MKITNRTIKRITIISTFAAVIFFVIALVFFLASPILDYTIVIAIAIGVVPPSVGQILHNRWKVKIERATPEFLRDLATASRTGIPLQVALEHAAKRMYGPLTGELQILVAHMSWGMNFNDALTEFSDRLNLPLIQKATVLINEAGKHGGDLSNIFDSTAKYLESMNAWNEKRRMQTLPYVAIFYFSVFMFLFIIIVISRMMFAPLSHTSATGASSFIKPILTQADSRRLFFHAALLEAMFGGLIAGKVNEDSFLDGLKHVAVLAVATGIAFFMFLP
ncbi:MAG: type II secretion system F family protein [Candidatus Bathyarchaeia archaeon]|jgi:flagellar protein FlaJ